MLISKIGVAARAANVYTENNGYLELLPCGRGWSNCCLWKEQCGSNGLCRNLDNVYARQYCSDKEWNNCSTIAPGTLIEMDEHNIGAD